MLSNCLLTAAEVWSAYFQAYTVALFVSIKQIRTCTGQRVWCLLCLLYCRQTKATPPEASCSHYSCYTSVTKVPLSVWHTQDPLCILYMLNDRHSFECFVPRRSLCLRFLASRFQHLEAVQLRYFFCDTTLCQWVLVVPRFEMCGSLTSRCRVSVQNSVLDIRLVEVSALRHIEMSANRHPVTERTYPFYSVDGRWVDERGGLLVLCWQTGTQARGEKPAPAPRGVSALGRCQSS